MKRIWKIISVLLAAAMLFCSIPANAVFADSSTGDGDVVYAVHFPVQSGFQVYEVDTAYGADDLTLLSGTDASVLKGDDYTFLIKPDDAYKTNSNIHVYADGQLLTPDSSGYYTLQDVSQDTSIQIAGCSQVPVTYHAVTFSPGDHYAIVPVYQRTGETTSVIDGGYYSFRVDLDAAYSNSEYAVLVNGATVSADQSGVYTVQATSDLSIQVTGTFTVNSYEQTCTYNESVYSVVINGSNVASGSPVDVKYGESLQLQVTDLGGNGATVVRDNASILTPSSVSGNVYTYNISGITKDMAYKIVQKTCGVSFYEDSTSYYGTRWTYGFYNGSGPVLGYGEDKLYFYIKLMPGYTDSPINIFIRGFTDPPTLVSEDKANGIYYYEQDNIDYGSITSLFIYVASKDAQYSSRIPIQPNQYTATFHYNDEAATAVTQTTAYGGTVSAPQEIIWDGHVFDGWYTSAGRAYDFSKMVSGNVSLYGKWEKGYTVTFNYNNGNSALKKTVAEGSSVSQPSAPKKTGYTFLGWYTEDGSKYDFTSSVSEDLNLTAKWNKITATVISSLSFSGISDKVYTGTAIKPAVTVKKGNTVLVKGTDYTVSYTNNIKVGVATVKVTGKGNYTGTKKLTFTIYPKATKLTSVSASGTKKITVKWKKISGSAGYIIYRSNKKSGTYTKIRSVLSAAGSITDTSVASGKRYYYKVKVVTKSGTIYYASNYSNILSAKAK